MRTGLAAVGASLLLSAMASAQAADRATTLHLGTSVPLVTTVALSSRTSAKGDLVPLRTSADVLVDGVVVIPAGTEATGQVEESRGTGGFGTNGRLAIRPLYLRTKSGLIRLAGVAAKSGRTRADTVVGMMLLTPMVSGRSASMPVGTAVDAIVEKTVRLEASPAG